MDTNEVTAPSFTDPKITAAAARQTLQAGFPGVKFSVRCSRGTGWGYISCDWTDGPTVDLVERHLWDNHPIPRLCGAWLVQRSYSPGAEDWAHAQVQAHPDRYTHDYDHGGSTYYAERSALAGRDFRSVA